MSSAAPVRVSLRVLDRIGTLRTTLIEHKRGELTANYWTIVEVRMGSVKSLIRYKLREILQRTVPEDKLDILYSEKINSQKEFKM